MAKKTILCASCQVECEVEGNKITCPQCGSSFVKQGGEMKIKEIGRIDKIEQRLDALEQPEPEPEPESESEPETETDNNEDLW